MKSILLISPTYPLANIPNFLEPLQEILLENMMATDTQRLESQGFKVREPSFGSYQVSRGLLCIASVLEREGFDVKYLQMDFEKDKRKSQKNWLINCLKENLNNVDIVGITSYTYNFYDAANTASVIKTINPDIKVVFGGHHVSALPEETLKHEDVDIVIRGEGEYTFLGLCKNLSDRKNLKKVKGISYKEKDKIRHNPPQEFSVNQDIPSPAYHLLPKTKNLMLVLETSRGCPFKCLFCAETAFWKKVRYRKIRDTIDEIRFIKENDYTGVHICDSIFPLNKTHVRDFVNAVKREKIDMNFSCNARIEFLDEELLGMLKSANFYRLFVGIESGSDVVLKFMRKSATFKRYYSSLKKVKRFIPVIDSSWIVGHPPETHKTAMESIMCMDLLMRERLVDSVWPRVFIPYPGTEPFHFPKKYGMKILTKKWDNYTRFAFLPVYRLNQLSELQIYGYYLEMFFTALKYYLEQQNKEIDFSKLLKEYSVEKILH